MKLKIVGFLTALLVSATVHATPVLLGTVEHNYGSGTGQIAPTSQGAGSCDVLNVNSVSVRSASHCQRFYDKFDLSAFVADTIESFSLTLNFVGARNEVFGFERWAPRPASSASVGSGQTQTFLEANGPQTWTFDSNLDVFADIVSGDAFYLWMSRELGFGANTVTIDSAQLKVYGATANAVPLPGTLPLLGLAFLGMMAVRSRQGKQKPGQLKLSQ